MISVLQILRQDEDYINLINDIIKYTTIVVVMNLLFYVSKPKTTFLNSIFIDIESFLTIGLCAYWLIVKRLVKF